MRQGNKGTTRWHERHLKSDVWKYRVASVVSAIELTQIVFDVANYFAEFIGMCDDFARFIVCQCLGVITKDDNWCEVSRE